MTKAPTTILQLELDSVMQARLAELADFHEATPEETLHICLRHEWRSLQMLIADGEKVRRNPRFPLPEGDDELPF